MSSTLTASIREPIRSSLIPENDVVFLRGVTWQEYLTYRDDPANDGVRMYYSDGILLLMTTGQLHERIKTLLGQLLYVWVEEQDQGIMCFGQWTLQKELIKKGLEADNCYYVSHLPDVEGKKEIDLENDPAPDLAIEVDVTTQSQHKFGIYASLGVSEIWVWSEDHIAVYQQSEEGAYSEVDGSNELRGFPLDVAAAILLAHYARNDVFVMAEFRKALAEPQ